MQPTAYSETWAALSTSPAGQVFRVSVRTMPQANYVRRERKRSWWTIMPRAAVVIGQMLGGERAAVLLCDGAAQAREELGRTHRNGIQYHMIPLEEQMPSDNGIELAMGFDLSDRERAIEPAEGFFDDPAFGQDLESVKLWAFDDLDQV